MEIIVYPLPRVVVRIKFIRKDKTLCVELCTWKGRTKVSNYHMSSAFSEVKAWYREFSVRSSSEWPSLMYLTCHAIPFPITQKPCVRVWGAMPLKMTHPSVVTERHSCLTTKYLQGSWLCVTFIIPLHKIAAAIASLCNSLLLPVLHLDSLLTELLENTKFLTF